MLIPTHLPHSWDEGGVKTLVWALGEVGQMLNDVRRVVDQARWRGSLPRMGPATARHRARPKIIVGGGVNVQLTRDVEGYVAEVKPRGLGEDASREEAVRSFLVEHGLVDAMSWSGAR